MIITYYARCVLAVIDLKGNVNYEVVRKLNTTILEILNNVGVTPENIRTRLKWKYTRADKELTDEVVKQEANFDYIELPYRAEVSTDYVSRFMEFITQPLNGSRRFIFDNNPQVVKIKNRVEDILDEAIDNNVIMKKLIKDNGIFLTYDVEVSFKDKSMLIDDVLVIDLVVNVNQRD